MMTIDLIMCAICHTNKDIAAYPMMKNDGGIVGFYYVCTYCIPEFSQKNICIGNIIKTTYTIKMENNTYLLNVVDKKNILRVNEWTKSWLFNTKEEAETILYKYSIEGRIIKHVVLEIK
jgi:hypothetical protein